MCPQLGSEVRVQDGPFSLDVWPHHPAAWLLVPWGDVQVLNLAPLSPYPCPLSPGITRCFPFAGKSHAHNIKWRTHIWARAFPGGPVVQNSPASAGYGFHPCAVLSLSVMSNSAIPWTLAQQAPLSMGILQARILKWVAMPSLALIPGPRLNSFGAWTWLLWGMWNFSRFSVWSRKIPHALE